MGFQVYADILNAFDVRIVCVRRSCVSSGLVDGGRSRQNPRGRLLPGSGCRVPGLPVGFDCLPAFRTSNAFELSAWWFLQHGGVRIRAVLGRFLGGLSLIRFGGSGVRGFGHLPTGPRGRFSTDS